MNDGRSAASAAESAERLETENFKLETCPSFVSQRVAMKLFQLEDLRTLAQIQRWPCITICQPTFRTGQETRENPIRLRNAVSAAIEQLMKTGHSKAEAAQFLTPVQDLNTSRDFWLHPADGLAVFVAPEFFRYYRVPLSLREDVVVADHFSLKQLLPLFTEDGRFYILALSQKQIRFFDATRTGIQERVVPDMVRSIEDLKQFEEVEAHLQGHTMSLTRSTRTDIVFHGQGNIADKTTYKADVSQYLQLVSRQLERFLGAETAPLVLAAVEYEQSFYRQVNSYHNLLENGIVGNPDGLDEEEIHEAAWRVVEPHFAEARKTALEHYGDLSGTDKTSDRIEEILPAAFYGRVRMLFLRGNARVWGRFDADTQSIVTHDRPRDDDTDLLDLATIYVLQNRGIVYALGEDEMPGASPQAALFRY